MSGVVKSVGKVFKKVVKTVKKVLPIALTVAAVVYTGGAALGISGFAGGWGAAVSGLTKSMGATGILGNVLTGAITQAGYGAALGGGLSLITGGDPVKGMQQGALSGAITGGAMGAFGLGTDPLKGIGETSGTEAAAAAGDQAANAAANPATAAPTNATATPAVGPSPVSGTAAAPSGPGLVPAATTPASTGVTTVSATPASASGSAGFFDKGGFLSRNQELAGRAVAGVGEGLISAAGSGEEAAALERAAQLEIQQRQAERDAINANFQTSGRGLLPAGTAVPGQDVERPNPNDRFPLVNKPASQQQQVYVYDPQVGAVVRKTVEV